MSRYLEILAVQRPFDIGEDENNRVMLSCNFEARAAAPVDQWEEEVMKVISDAGHGTSGTDMWGGSAAQIPTSGAGPFIQVIDTGGVAPEETHNGDLTELLSCQIIVRASTLAVARTRALAIWRALDGVRNQTVAA